MTLNNFVKSIQDIMRMDSGVDGDAQRISQLTWMLFLRVFDAKEEDWELEDEYSGPFVPEEYQWRSWAEDEEGITGDELLDFVNKMFSDLKNLVIDENTDRRKVLVKEVFEDANNYMKSGTLMRQVINKINEVDFGDYDERHAFNDIYETILRDLQSAGNAGEYYTPRAVTDFIINRLNPIIGEKIADFACGTGGFLVSALNYIKDKKLEITLEQDLKLKESLFGIEKKPMPHMLCVTNLILHDIDNPSILHGNSLATNIRDIKESEKFDVIAMNPPFGGTEEEGIKLNFPMEFRTSETADLFMTLIMNRLKKNGRAGVVLPNGFLFGTDNAKVSIKKKLLEEFNLHTIIRLPEKVFAPYADVATNLLFFDTKGPTKNIWFYEHTLPEGYKNYSKTKPIKFSEFQSEIDWWDNRTENDFAWKVDVQSVIDSGYNMDFKNPNRKSLLIDYNSKEIIEKFKTSDAKTSEILSKLKGLLDD